MPFADLPVDLLCGCLPFLAVADVCRMSRASRHSSCAAKLVWSNSTTLSVVSEPPFLTDSGLVHLLQRCPALTGVDIDARRLSDAGAAAIAAALSGLRYVALHHGYGLSGIVGLIAPPSQSTDAYGGDSSTSSSSFGNNHSPKSRGWTNNLSGKHELRRHPPRPSALRSLALCSVGSGSVGGSENTNESTGFAPHCEFADWQRLARRCFSSALRSLTLTNSSNDQYLPLLAISPFLPRPTNGGARDSPKACPAEQAAGCAASLHKQRTGTGVADGQSEQGDSARLCGRANRAGTTGAGRAVKAKSECARTAAEGTSPSDDGHESVLDLSLAMVKWTEFVQVLRQDTINNGIVSLPGQRDDAGVAPPSSLLPPLARLRRLCLVLDHITTFLCEAIAIGCPDVEELYLRQKYVHQPSAFCDAGLFHLARCKNLRSLTLKSDRMESGCSDVGFVYLAMELDKVEELTLCGMARASDSTAAAILDHPHRQLRRLHLEGPASLDGHVFIQPHFQTEQSSRRLATLRYLTSISLGYCRNVTPEALTALVSACGPCLESLDLTRCLVTDGLLRPILALPGLRDLSLNRCPFTNEGLISACQAGAPPPVEPGQRACHDELREEAQPRMEKYDDGDMAHPAPPQSLRRLSMAWCEGVRGSGIIAVLRSARLGAHSLSLEATGLSGMEDSQVEELMEFLPRLKELKLSYCYGLTRAAVASIVRSQCGRNTLSVLELRNCPVIDESALDLIKLPALPALVRLGWWGTDADGQRVAAERQGNCWVMPAS